MKYALPVFTIMTFVFSYYFTVLCYKGKKYGMHISPWLPLIIGLLLAPFACGRWISYNLRLSSPLLWVALYGECISIAAFFLGRHAVK
ncbi:MAG: hypothetical protein KIG81_01370 [Thermoguttaceae bacterium]|nr:hypothetical protein [Thermoguttaceae bacterium]